MSKAAKDMRDSAVVELDEAVRQAHRYLSSHQPSSRIIQQRIQRIRYCEGEFKRYHFSYCEASQVELNSIEEKKMLQEKLDAAMDAIDTCLAFIEDREAEEKEKEDKERKASTIEEEKRCLDSAYQRWLTEFALDQRAGKELCRKVELLEPEEGLPENIALMKTYQLSVADLVKALDQSWEKCFQLELNKEEIQKIGEEVFEVKSALQSASSSAVVFISKHEEKTPKDGERSNQSSANHATMKIKPDRLSYPKFDGNIRLFARFKRDFEEIVVPFYPESQRAYVLKQSCLVGKPQALVENLSDLDEIWMRLDDRFGDELDLVDLVLNDLSSLPKLKLSDDQQFVDLVDKLEGGILTLNRIGAKEDLANAYTVKILEKKLHRQTYLDWLKAESEIAGSSRFEKLFNFLKEERRRIEKLIQRYTDKEQPVKPKVGHSGGVNDQKLQLTRKGGKAAEQNEAGQERQKVVKNLCLIHPESNHFTRRCRTFLGKSAKERSEIVKQLKACPFCLSITHQDQPCTFKDRFEVCKIDDCGKPHSHLLHDAVTQGFLVCSSIARVTVNNVSVTEVLNITTLLQIQLVPTVHGEVMSFFDLGSTISLVSKSYVDRNNLKGIPISYDLITVGGDCKHQYSFLHVIRVIDRRKKEHVVQAIQIEDVCGFIQEVDLSAIGKIFRGIKPKDVRRPAGQIELLIGMPNANIHPVKMKTRNKLVLYKSIFGTGKVLGGSHRLLTSKDIISASAQKVAHSQILNATLSVNVCKCRNPGLDFFSTEDLGVKLSPRCDPCKRCRCTDGFHLMSRIEQQELAVIEGNLSLDPLRNEWTAKYPFKDPPAILENNERQADHLLLKLEKKYECKVDESAKYIDIYEDLIKRGILVEISDEELEKYEGPVFYVSHHAVFKEGSTSTPLRLVINSSLKYRGRSLNDICMKGPNVLNDILGVQLRFRSHKIAIVCDMKKMYNSVKTTIVERHLRRIKFRHFDKSKPMKTYGVDTVMFGDRPAAAIASTAVRMTAENFVDINPEASKRILRDSYVDDIATGAEDTDEADELKQGIVEILQRGGFHIKGFVTSGEIAGEDLTLLGNEEEGRVLGLWWDPREDIFKVKVKINFSRRKRDGDFGKDLTISEIPSIKQMKITRRMVLSVTNSCYDVFGGLSPITIKMKLGLRRLNDKGWDDELSEDEKEGWVKILTDVKKAESVTFKRCVKPEKAVGLPSLIISSDGSELAMCTTAHIRWLCEDGSIECGLWIARTRVAPLKKLTIPRIEMQSLVMGVRLAEAIKKNSIWSFEKIYHVTDSMCSLATLSKDSKALGEFVGNRVAEILSTTSIDQWYHVKSKDNISDLGTRENAKGEDVSENSYWQKGPPWMSLPVEEWPVEQDVGRTSIPEDFLFRSQVSFPIIAKANLVDYERYKNKPYNFARNITARVFSVKRTKSFIRNKIIIKDIDAAEEHMLKFSMKLTKAMLEEGKLKSLRPRVNDAGVIILGGRALDGMEAFYGHNEFPILVSKDPIAHMWMLQMHQEDHSGALKTVAKSKRRFWITRASRIASKIRRSCYRCRKLDKKLAQQQMSPLPRSRQLLAPAFYKVSLDLFGPYTIKDTVNKRCRMKVWGVIINCLATRAIHLDVTEGYSSDAVIQVMRRFLALRGNPCTVKSDKGSQLDATKMEDWAVSKRIEWVFAPAEGQHQNGASEALIKSVKRSLTHVIGETVLTYGGLQTVFYEVANLVNSRPIGIVTGSDPLDPAPITPNHLLLGRATAEVPQGYFTDQANVNRQYDHLQTLVSDWWKRWYASVLPSLVPSYKWYQRHRNVQEGDVCLIQYKKDIKGTYRLGRVTRVKKGTDGLVRSVHLKYRNAGEKTTREVERPIHGIAVIVPIEEQEVTSSLNPEANEFTPSSEQSSEQSNICTFFCRPGVFELVNGATHEQATNIREVLAATKTTCQPIETTCQPIETACQPIKSVYQQQQRVPAAAGESHKLPTLFESSQISCSAVN